MSKHLIKIDNPQHCALSVAHAGKDNQYCEAGEVVAIDWQPSAGWGLQEAHYTDEDGNVVDIDLSLREFTMPAKSVTIGGTAKRFVLPDWTGDKENEANNVLDWLTAGDITPKSDDPNEIVGKFAMETTGGDADIKNGKAYLRAVKGNLVSVDGVQTSFNAKKFVSTGMNLVDPTQKYEHGEGFMWFFPVVAGVWGQYGTTQENNGYVVFGDDIASDGVYFVDERPVGASIVASGGNPCPYQEHDGKKYYLPPTNGWLCIFADTLPACHIAWSNYNDNVAGVFGNSEIDLSAAIAAVHTWGLAGFVTPAKVVQDEIDLKAGKGYVRCDRVKLADLTWAMATVVTTDDENETTTTYVFTATVTNMAADGICAMDFDGIEANGNLLNMSSTTISSVNAFKSELGDAYIYFEKDTPSEVALPAVNGEFEANDFGLTYFLDADGELVGVPAYMTAAYYQGGKEQLFNAVTYQKILAEVVATALCQLNERVAALETRQTLNCVNLVVNRKFDMTGWRLVDEQPASATSPGRLGDYFIATGFMYICVATDTWKKITISNF